MSDRQFEWDSADALLRLEAVEKARAALESLENEQSMLRLRLRRMPRAIEEARWKLAEAIRLALHYSRRAHLGPEEES